MNDRARFDPQVLAGIENKVGRERTKQILDLFLSQASGRLEKVRDAARSGDLPASATALHSIKGSAAMLGATALTEVLERMERLANENDGGALAALLGELEDVFVEAEGFLRARREALGR